MKVIKKVLISVLLIGIIFILNTAVKAANVSITTSKGTVKPGESFKVTVSVSDGAGYVSASVTNGSGGFGSAWLENGSKSFTCKAGSSGSVTIKTSGTVADFSTEKDESASRTKSVKIKEETKKTTKTTTNKTSASNTKKTKEEDKTEEKVKTQEPQEQQSEEKETKYLLNTLEILDNTISPNFKSEVFEYEVKIKGNNIKVLDINAKANNDEAIMNITGNENLQLGENIITIELKGQDDKEITTYKIKVIKDKSDLDLANEEIDKLNSKNRKLLIAVIIFFVTTIILGISLVIDKKSKKEDK